MAEKIREIKQRGLRDAPCNRRVYPLSGVMKCGVCGTAYTGDNGFYRCNSKGKGKTKCENNNIAQNTAEEAVFLLISEVILNTKNANAFMGRLRKRIGKGQGEIRSLEKNLDKVQSQIDRALKLYQLGTIDMEDIERQLVPLQEQKKAVAENIDRIKSARGIGNITSGQVLNVISQLREEFRNADPKIQKRVARTLFDEIRIYPKQGTPWKWERYLEAKGVQLPLTRVNVVIPRGIEPRLPA